MSLTLEKSLEIALSDNPTIKVADLEIERQEWVRKETKGNLLPQLSATGQYTRSIVKQEMAKGLSFGADNTFTGTASMSMALFAPSVYATLKMNSTQMESAVESARQSRITLVNSVKKAYYNILLAQKSLVVLKASEASIQKTVDYTRKMYENDLSSEYDLLSAEVQLSNLKPSILQTETSIETAKLLFRMYLGLPNDVDFDLEGTLEDFADRYNYTTGDLSTDVSENSDLRTLELQAKLLDNQLNLYRTQKMPTLAAFGQAIYTGNDMDMSAFGGLIGGGSGEGSGSTTTSSSKYWWQNPMSVGLTLSVPIFSGLTNNRRIRQAKNSIEQINLQRDYLQQSIDVQVRNSINSIRTAYASIEANDITVRQAQKAYDIAVTRYNAGAGTILELNSSELALTQAKLNYSQAVYDYLSAEADYVQTLGRQ